MEIKNFIKIYDEVLPWNVLSNLISYANISNFIETEIGGNEGTPLVNFNIRKTYTLPLSNLSNSLSNVHWFNLLQFYFDMGLKKYSLDSKIIDFSFKNI